MIKLTNTFGPLLSKLVSLRAPPASQEMDRWAGTAGSEAPPWRGFVVRPKYSARNDTRFHVSSGLYHRRMLRNLNRHAFGQSLVEYVTIIGIIMMVFVTLTPNIKRSIQALIKMTADQIGEQKNADFDYDPKKKGYVLEASTNMFATSGRIVNETIGDTVYYPNEKTMMSTNSITDMGFREIPK